MDKIIECVPNFSEGRDENKIEQIVSAIANVPGARVLNVDPGMDANRTVVTFVGSESAVLEAAFRGIEKASHIIDMSQHTGEHARIGATDVCPLIPLKNATMDDCVQIAQKLGKQVGDELGIPVYLYENSAENPDNKNLAAIRKGQYEGLGEKLKQPKWKPDFGPGEFNVKTGATVIGARSILVAFNVNLETRDVAIAKKIASRVRESGFLTRDETGKQNRIPGKFKAVKAIGWYMQEFGRSQVSMNLTDYEISPPHSVYEFIKELAAELGTRVTGSELVGMIPQNAMLAAGRFYAESDILQNDLIEIAVKRLGLSDVKEFISKERIIEYALENTPK